MNLNEFLNKIEESQTTDLKWIFSKNIHPKYKEGIIITYANPQINPEFKEAKKLFKLLYAKKDAYNNDSTININNTKKNLNSFLKDKFFEITSKENFMFPIPMKGKYGSTEPSFIIYNSNHHDGERLAKAFGQHSFLYFNKSKDGKFTVSSYVRKFYDKPIYYKTNTTSVVNYLDSSEVDNFFSKKRGFMFSFDFGDDAFPETKYISKLAQFVDGTFYSLFKFMNKKEIKEYNQTFDNVMFENRKNIYLRQHIEKSFKLI